ncbi:MAG: DnaJ C-terminal domain-containing protein [Phenylobacterium sp.]
MNLDRARQLIGVSASASTPEIRRAFRVAVKAAHPDRGGSAEAFREVVEAYHLLQRTPGKPRPAKAARSWSARESKTELVISPEVAVLGGEVEHAADGGRRLRLTLPAGLRAGDKVRADGVELPVVIRGDGELIVRGDDLWITARIPAKLLAQGGKLAVETPLGRRVVFITEKASAQALVRLQGQGLPARGRHRQGHLFVRLEPGEAEPASTLRRRFTAAWAA